MLLAEGEPFRQKGRRHSGYNAMLDADLFLCDEKSSH